MLTPSSASRSAFCTGRSSARLVEIVLALDEFEAIRLADLEGLYQEQAAERMRVSRSTFGRILAAAHRKVAEALAHGKTLKIEGGEARRPPRRDRPFL